MFKKSSPEPLTLTVDDHTYAFHGPSEFEFSLSGRTCLPSAKISSLVELSDDALLREAEAIRKVEQRFADALSGAYGDSARISPFLESLDQSLISHDNDWRSIVNALNAAEGPFEEYKKIALVKYMQYLTSRQEVVKSLYANRQVHKQQSSAPSVNGNGGYRRDSKYRETLLFDILPQAEFEHGEMDFCRLPKGETVEIDFEPNQSIHVLLAKHRCTIVFEEDMVFVDEKGRNCVLQRGRNIVGRDASSDIVINPNLRDVSRKHLIVETDGEGLVRLTDISSHGTSIPPEFLEKTII